MIEFKILLDEQIVETIGHQQIQDYLQEFVDKLVLKLAAKDAIEDLKTIEIENNKKWQLARKLAWEQEKSKYINS